MSAATPVAAVIFDYGGVLTSSTGDAIRAWLEADGVSPDSYRRALGAWLSADAPEDNPLHRLERGEIGSDEFGDLLAAELVHTDGAPVIGTGLLDRAFARVEPDEAMYALVDDLRASGVRVGLLSNSWGNTYPHERLSASFDHIVISGEVGMRKPRPEIYELAVRGVGVEAGRAVFVDDAVPNLAGARAIGLRAVHHTGAATTREQLAAMVPGLATNGVLR